jgi:alpha-tubulin suppressor-like RCC1 family protein
MRTIAIGLTQTSGPGASPIRVQTHSSMNFAAPQHSPSSWISSVGSNVTGGYHTCAVRSMGEARCWGFGASGQLGTGSTSNSTWPVPVLNLDDAVVVSAGGNHTCASRETGAVACWGHGEQGQLGNGLTSDSSVPVPVSNLGDAVAVSAGWSHHCALRETGAVACWGYGEYGQLGDGSTSDSSVPVTVVNEGPS